MKLGYTILAEAFMKRGRYKDGLTAVEKLPEGRGKELLLREARNGAVKTGDIETYRKASRMVGLPKANETNLAAMFMANIQTQDFDAMAEILGLLPDGSDKDELINSAILQSANKGRIIMCEKLAEKRGRALTKAEAMLAKIAAVREGWIYDAWRSAKSAGVELTKEDYAIMYVANKDKGRIREAIETAEKAGIEITPDAWSTMLLAAIEFDRNTVWDIAEKF